MDLDFTTFIISLASSVQVHLGRVANPESKKVETNLEMARQTIDILGILEEKTRGNLTEQEDKILQAILNDLRTQYVEAGK